MKKSSPIVPVIAWLLVVVVLDQLTKLWVMASFSMYETRPIIPGLFNLTYITNTGAAFGMFAGAQSMGRQIFFLAIGMAALLVMFFSYRHFHSQGRMFVHAIGLIAGGAIGNLIDRLRLGSVVDFLDFYIKEHHWPAFNVADSAITVGVGLFILGSMLTKDRGQI